MMTLTDQRRKQMNDVHHVVNSGFRYTTDIKHYGQEEFWEQPDDLKGDCEDYALTKRKMLRTLGWAMEHLDIAICMVDGTGHAVLIAHTDKGDFVLDNNHARPMHWEDLGDYKWVAMTSGGKLNNWVRITA